MELLFLKSGAQIVFTSGPPDVCGMLIIAIISLQDILLGVKVLRSVVCFGERSCNTR
jgi:hypothetical protein